MHSEIQVVPKDTEEASMHNIKLNPIRIKHGKYRGLLLFHQLYFFICEWIYNTCLCHDMAFSVDRFPTVVSFVDDKTENRFYI